MTKEQAEKVLHLIESGDTNVDLRDFALNCSEIDDNLADVLIFALKKGWSADDLFNVAKTITALQQILL